ncbi:hypothetical protein K504DRAFT_503252 [Pleomassaria siparia CBS 279.74]|uniref:Uncharacterized protein n=1 Tax=Pleomassaria siparia CBS 279.74 TaxID=1314801 RepID=A0A6G1K5I6_9PLEO|nr:hypothetical protein K504DRAFT_503252 [Pleomassaria siparia CBS 279.74]
MTSLSFSLTPRSDLCGSGIAKNILIQPALLQSTARSVKGSQADTYPDPPIEVRNDKVASSRPCPHPLPYRNYVLDSRMVPQVAHRSPDRPLQIMFAWPCPGISLRHENIARNQQRRASWAIQSPKLQVPLEPTTRSVRLRPSNPSPASYSQAKMSITHEVNSIR